MRDQRVNQDALLDALAAAKKQVKDLQEEMAYQQQEIDAHRAEIARLRGSLGRRPKIYAEADLNG